MSVVTVAELSEMTLTAKSVKELFEMSRTNIRALTKLEVLAPEDGEYPLVPIIRGLLTHYRTRKNEKFDLGKERALTERVRREIMCQRRDANSGKLLLLTDVEENWENTILTFRARLSVIPERLSPMLLTKTVEETRKILEKEIEAALAELANLTFGEDISRAEELEGAELEAPTKDEDQVQDTVAVGPITEEITEDDSDEVAATSAAPPYPAAEIDGDAVG